MQPNNDKPDFEKGFFVGGCPLPVFFRFKNFADTLKGGCYWASIDALLDFRETYFASLGLALPENIEPKALSDEKPKADKKTVKTLGAELR